MVRRRLLTSPAPGGDAADPLAVHPLPTVAKLSGTTAKVTIPKSYLTPAYWWGVASLWDGPAPCGNGCVDFVPNTFPDVLHDLLPPVITMTTTPLRVWGSSTDANFTFPFQVSDAHSRGPDMDPTEPPGRGRPMDDRGQWHGCRVEEP